VANISGTVLLNIFDELERITKKGGILILTGFTQAELPAFTSRLRADRILEADDWRCIVGRPFP
jgi:ribosomal protein L11 methylase PrmA